MIALRTSSLDPLVTNEALFSTRYVTLIHESSVLTSVAQ